MLSILASIFFSASLLAAAAVLLGSLEEARLFFADMREAAPVPPEARRRAVAIRRVVRFAQTPLRAAA